MVGRIIPEIVEDRLRQHCRLEAAEEIYRRLRLETTGLRDELTQLQVEARALRGQFVEIADTASSAVAQLGATIRAFQEIQQRQPSPAPAVAAESLPVARIRSGLAGLIAAVVTAALLSVVALVVVHFKLPPQVPPVVAPTHPLALPEPPAAPLTTDRLPAPEAPAPPVVARVPERPLRILRNEIRHFQVVNLSGHEMQVVVDYAYGGDHGTSDVFIHAAALKEGEELRSRVPGTGFPFAPIRVGDGSAVINITKQPDTGPSVSTRVKICMVSIKSRAAFYCETFPYIRAWDS